MRRVFYSAAWWLALPVVLGRLWWRGRKEPGYRQHVAERLGCYRATPFRDATRHTIWVHAVSVGETRAAEPLVRTLLDAFPDSRILLTHMTPTGRATGLALFGNDAPRVLQCYLPYDTGWMVARFLRYFLPRICILMETEVWPNLIAHCAAHDVPVVLANARLSQRSLRKAHRLSSLITDAAQKIACVAAQTEADAGRIKQLGVHNIHVTGSIKFDVAPPMPALEAGARLRAQIGQRPVLLCASTREGEEVLILNALDRVDIADALVLIVPRHPQRFDDVARLIVERGIGLARRSQMGGAMLPRDVRVLLGDSMGEMFAYYAACDVAFIGGSLLPLGGQNLIEACAVGKPVLIGPHTFNFSAVSEDAIAAGAALRVSDAADMLAAANRLLRDAPVRQAMGTRAQAFAQQHRGATARTMRLLQPLIR